MNVSAACYGEKEDSKGAGKNGQPKGDGKKGGGQKGGGKKVKSTGKVD